MTHLFSPLKIKEVTFRNRIFMSPMCQYSSKDGLFQAWHQIHYGTRATGGASLILFEASGVSADGRISNADLGLWNEDQVLAMGTCLDYIRAEGACTGVQIAHAGRKGVAAEKFNPTEMSVSKIKEVVQEFSRSVQLAVKAGFDVVELHMAHGYLMHSFLSPISNQRNDQYGGTLEKRLAFPIEVVREVRKIWPQNKPLFVRVSATDWVDGGWDLSQTIQLVHRLKEIGVDFIDCSSGGLVPDAKIPIAPGYQVQFADEIRRQCDILTGAVGLITDATHAERILSENKADAILLGRELLRNPYWPLHAASKLKADVRWPEQYLRAKI